MTKTENTTRAALVAAAADLWAGDDPPYWDASEYMRGMCELIANATGADDPMNATSEAWEEIAAAHKLASLRARAEQIAANIALGVDAYEGSAEEVGHPGGQPIIETFPALRDMLTAAALAALTEKESTR